MALLSELLKERGYVHQFSSATLEEITDEKKRTVYLGIDPSADSLHIGNLQAMIVLRRFLEAGHKVILVIGGGTGMIGDPSGKSEERNLLDDETIEKNAKGIEAQARRLFAGMDFVLVNNASWLRPLNFIEFLRDIGKHFSVNAMLQRDSIRERINREGEGISYTEFSYMLLQAYDFLVLNETHGCDVQIGASDQWGNIVSGVDLIRRKKGAAAYALVSPLLVDKATGKKFGKSESGAVWLDPAKTSPFKFYQFWLNVDDATVEELLMKMTLLEVSDIRGVMEEHVNRPADRIAQKRLAFAVTQLVHGKTIAEIMEKVSEALFGNADISSLPQLAQELIQKEAPNHGVRVGDSLLDVLVSSGLASSKREARQFIDDGSILLNGAKISDANRNIMKEDFQSIPLALLKRGKRNVTVLVQN